MTETILQPLGVDLGAEPLSELTDADVERLRVLLALYGVVVARDQVELDDTGFEHFLRRFGAPVFTVGETPLPGHPDLNVISNVGRTSPPRRFRSRRRPRNRARRCGPPPPRRAPDR